MTNYTTRVEQNFSQTHVALAQAVAARERAWAWSRLPACGVGWVGKKKTLTCLRCMSLFVMNFLVLILQALSDMLTL